MNNSIKALMAGAALAGLMAGTSGKLRAQSASQPEAAGANPAQQDDSQAGKKSKSKIEKHACKGQNSCKGKGGCKAGDNGCKGKNTCKGKGGCATDGSKPPDQK